MQSPVNRIIVRVDQLFQDKIGSLYIDNTFNPQNHIAIKGVVVSPPAKLSKEYLDAGFENIVEEGDTVYFNYVTCMDPSNRMDVLEDGVPTVYWLLDYWMAFCKIDKTKEGDDRIVPIGPHVFLEPVYREEKKIGLIIVPEMSGNKEEEWSIFCAGKVDVKKGSKVYYDKYGRFENEIEGKKYYVMYDYNIHGVLW